MIRPFAKYIAVWLVAVFTVTMIPFNAIHQHEEDGHHAALVTQENAHHCELDEHSCQGEFSSACEHTAHLCASHPECFSCEFHFIKTFTTALVLFEAKQHENVLSFASFAGSGTAVHPDAPNNKGPPRA